MAAIHISRARALSNLKTQWMVLALFALFFLTGGYLILAQTLSLGDAARWLVVSASVLVFQLVILWNDLELNYSANRRSYFPTLGMGIWLSSLRLLCIGLLAGFLILPLPTGWLAWAPLGLNLISNFSDLIDGYAARLSGQTTLLGQKLDLDLDSRGMLMATLLAFHYGRVGWWFLLVGLARYLFVFGIWLRKRFGLRLKPLQASPTRRPLAGVQMGIASGLLAPILSPAATMFVSTLSMFPFLGNFFYDWLQVSDKLPFTKRNRKTLARLWKNISSWGPLLVRVLLVVALLIKMAGPGVTDTYLFFAAIAIVAFAFGIAGRLFAIVALIETSLLLFGQNLQRIDFFLLFSATALLYLGTGAYSLWKPEDALIKYRLGEKRAA